MPVPFPHANVSKCYFGIIVSLLVKQIAVVGVVRVVGVGGGMPTESL